MLAWQRSRDVFPAKVVQSSEAVDFDEALLGSSGWSMDGAEGMLERAFLCHPAVTQACCGMWLRLKPKQLVNLVDWKKIFR